MKNWEFAFTGDWPAGIVLLIAASAVALAWLFYRRKRAQLSPRRFAILLVLRILMIVGVALFLLKPVLRFSRNRTEQNQVVVLQDVSQSMGIHDAVAGKSRLEAGLSVLREPPGNLLNRLAAGHTVHFFTFGAFTEEAKPSGDFKADQRATALGDGLKESVARVGQQGIGAVIVLTDGVSNSGEDPRQVARALGVPIFPVALGAKMAEKGKFFDIGIAGVPHNAELIVNNTGKLRIKVSNFGLEGFSDADRSLTLTLKKKDEVVSTAPVQFPRENGARDVEIAYAPKEPGVERLTVSLPVLQGEPVVENNSREFMVRVIDPQLRALIVEGVVRSEYRFLRKVLGGDPNVELTSVIKKSKEDFYHQDKDPGVDLSRGLPRKLEDAKKFDVIILGDIAREEFAEEQLQCLKEFVAGGGGLLVIGGYHAYGPGGYTGSALDDLLPVKIRGPSDGQVEGSFALKLTPDGKEHPVFEGCAKFFADSSPVQTLLDGANRVAGVKPGASVLAVHPREKIGDEPLPVVAVQQYGSGRVLALTADTTWKWKFQMEGKGQDSPYYRFWRQSVRWAAGRKEPGVKSGKERLIAWPDKIEYPYGDHAAITVRVNDKEGDPEEKAAVAVTIQYPVPVVKTPAPSKAGGSSEKGKPPQRTETRQETLKLEPDSMAVGEYRALFDPPVSGLYRATVKASDKAGEIGQAAFEFSVGQTAGEFDRVDVDEVLLQTLAAETGGEFHTFADANHIPDELDKKQRPIMYHEERNLWNAPLFALVPVICASLEWILRKRNALN